jgi:hypothetical protein
VVIAANCVERDTCGGTGLPRRHGLRMTAGILLVALTLVDLRACNTFAGEPSTAAVPTKTYKSEQFKFSFEYPASWSVQEGATSDRSQLLSLKLLSRDENVDVSRDYSPGSFGIEVFANPRQLELRDWLDAHGWPFGESGRSVTATSIGGLPALEIATGKMFAPNRFIYVAAHGVIVRLAPLAAQSQAVLRSFRFEPEQ